MMTIMIHLRLITIQNYCTGLCCVLVCRHIVPEHARSEHDPILRTLTEHVRLRLQHVDDQEAEQFHRSNHSVRGVLPQLALLPNNEKKKFIINFFLTHKSFIIAHC